MDTTDGGSAHVDVADTRWGRRPGARPPLPAWTPVAFAVGLGLLLTLVVVLVVRPPGPLDQASLADQRNGLLLEGPTVAREVAGATFGDQPVVLLFLREPPDAETLAGWEGGIPDRARVVAVVQTADPEPSQVPGVTVLDDREQRLATAVDLPEPNAGGPGVGYAVVDSDRVVRYATLDPAWRFNAFEVATIVGSVP